MTKSAPAEATHDSPIGNGQDGKWRRWAHRLGMGFMLLGLLFIALVLVEQLPNLAEHDWPDGALAGVLLAVVVTRLGYLPASMGFFLTLRDLGERCTWGQLVSINLVSQAGKYLPGNVGHLLGRAALAKGFGLSVRRVGFASGYELLWLLSSGGLFVLLSLGGSLLTRLDMEGISEDATWGLVLAAVALILLGSRLLSWVLNRWRPPAVRWILGDETYAPPTWGTTLVAMLGQMSGQWLQGAALWILAEALLGDAGSLLLLAGFHTAARLVGFLTPGAPGGLGVKEGVLVALLIPGYGEVGAVLLATVLRLVHIAGDFLAFFIGVLVLRFRYGMSWRSGSE